jgi:hypothetical protein
MTAIPEGGLKAEPGSAEYRLWELLLRKPGVKPNREDVKRAARGQG